MHRVGRLSGNGVLLRSDPQLGSGGLEGMPRSYIPSQNYQPSGRVAHLFLGNTCLGNSLMELSDRASGSSEEYPMMCAGARLSRRAPSDARRRAPPIDGSSVPRRTRTRYLHPIKLHMFSTLSYNRSSPFSMHSRRKLSILLFILFLYKNAICTSCTKNMRRTTNKYVRAIETPGAHDWRSLKIHCDRHNFSRPSGYPDIRISLSISLDKDLSGAETSGPAPGVEQISRTNI